MLYEFINKISNSGLQICHKEWEFVPASPLKKNMWTYFKHSLIRLSLNLGPVRQLLKTLPRHLGEWGIEILGWCSWPCVPEVLGNECKRWDKPQQPCVWSLWLMPHSETALKRGKAVPFSLHMEYYTIVIIFVITINVWVRPRKQRQA